MKVNYLQSTVHTDLEYFQAGGIHHLSGPLVPVLIILLLHFLMIWHLFTNSKSSTAQQGWVSPPLCSQLLLLRRAGKAQGPFLGKWLRAAVMFLPYWAVLFFLKEVKLYFWTTILKGFFNQHNSFSSRQFH